MPTWDVQFRHGGVWLQRLGLWLDVREPQAGPEKVFVSHAHTDHVAAHREVILSAPTAHLMQARLGGPRLEHVLAFGETRPFDGGSVPFQITLLPAGHIFGSAMAFIEAEGQSLLYTGDFKLRRGLSAEECTPRPADLLIMETTYGRPQYRFPPTEDVLRGVVRFCREAIDNDETAVLLGYSLGKSQELLRGLADAGLPLMLHGTVFKLTQIYEQFGQRFPAYERYEAGRAQRKVLLCPPSVAHSAMLRNLGSRRVAVLTGWAVDPNCRFRYGADAAFALSDHADFADLVEFVKQVAPKKVLTLHGFAADFAQTLRGLGFEASALSEDEQMALPLYWEKASPPPRGHPLQEPERGVYAASTSDALETSDAKRRERRAPVPGPHARSISEVGALHESRSSPALRDESAHSSESKIENQKSEMPQRSFAAFAETCAGIAATSSKLEKVRLLAEYFRRVDALASVATWFTGTPFPSSHNRVLQLGWALLSDALCAVGGLNPSDLHQVYLKHSDLGETAFEVWQARISLTPSLTIEGVQRFFDQIQAERGRSAKLPRLIHVLQQCSPLEAKFLVKIITGDLRIGLKEGLVEEAIALAFAVPADDVRLANLLLGDIGQAAQLAQRRDLASASIAPFRPVKFMLASPEPTAEAIWERIQAKPNAPPVSHPENAAPGSTEASSPNDSELTGRRDACPTLWLEDKYDGIRCQLHKVGQRVALYSRDLKEITNTFLEVADAARRLSADVILDGEILAVRGDQALPFSELQKRLGRREGDLFLGAEIPIQFVAFDLLWRNGESFLRHTLQSRRQALEALGPWSTPFRLAQITLARSISEIEAAFEAARDRANEGLMVKDPQSAYSPGRRGLSWLKLKRPFATLDCVVVGAEYGHGKRKNVLSDYTFAVRDEATGELKTIGKAYSGLTDAEIAQLTQHFLSRVIRQHGRYHEVEPDTVLEIAFDRLQPSARHTSGLALRFPRILRIRADKQVAEIDTLATARALVKQS